MRKTLFRLFKFRTACNFATIVSSITDTALLIYLMLSPRETNFLSLLIDNNLRL